MPNFGADQPRQFVLDSSRQNNAAPGRFYQDNNRYVVDVMLYDNSVPVTIPAGVDITIGVRLNKPNSIVYVLDKNHPDFAKVVTYAPDTNVVRVDKWDAMVEQAGDMLFAITIGGISSYTAIYHVDENKMRGKTVYHNPVGTDTLAKSDLSNVSDDNFKKKALNSNFLQNDMSNVDASSFDEKVKNTSIAKQVGVNAKNIAMALDAGYFDTELKRNASFQALANGSHPTTASLTPAEIKSLFFANRYEETDSVDLTNKIYADPKVLYLAFQLTRDNQVINQVLPPVSNDQIIMIDLIRAKNVVGGKIVFTAYQNDKLNGFSAPVEVSDEGHVGYWLPVDNEQSYDFFSNAKTQAYAMTFSDEKGNISLGAKEVVFEKATIEEDSNGVIHVKPDAPTDPQNGLSFADGLTGKSFTPKKVASLDKSVRIAALDADTADFSVDIPNIAEGVFAKLGNPVNVNTNYHDNRPYYSAAWKYTKQYIREDMLNKSWTIQDGSMIDPLISGGSTVRLGMHMKTLNKAVATEKGYVRLKVVDALTRDILVADDGFPMAVQRDYEAGDAIKPEFMVRSLTVTSQVNVAFEIECSFPNQIIVLDPASCIYIQVIDSENVTGIAEMMFTQHTGIVIDAASRYYGFNWMNLAASLTKTKGEVEFDAGDTEEMGNGLFLTFLQKAKCKIENNQLIVSDDGTNIPVFCIGQIADRKDTASLILKNLLVKVRLQNKNNAYVYALMKWTKEEDATLPILTGYQNDQPEFADGWVKVADRAIPEDAISDVHEDTNAFTVPVGTEQFAVILYPLVNQIPTTLVLEDFEVDVNPAFTLHYVNTTFDANQRNLGFDDHTYQSVSKTPSGYSALRYTINSADTKLPFGIVSGGPDIVNDRSWFTGSQHWEVEGDGVFKKAGRVKLVYSGLMYCGEGVGANSTSTCEFWLSKKQPDGSFVEIPGSRYTFVNEKSFSGAKHISSKEITFDVNADDVIRVYGKSSIDDGCYLQSGQDGSALLQLDIEYEEIVEVDKRVLDVIASSKDVVIMQGGLAVTDKKLVYDADKKEFTVVDK